MALSLVCYYSIWFLFYFHTLLGLEKSVSNTAAPNTVIYVGRFKKGINFCHHFFIWEDKVCSLRTVYFFISVYLQFRWPATRQTTGPAARSSTSLIYLLSLYTILDQAIVSSWVTCRSCSVCLPLLQPFFLNSLPAPPPTRLICFSGLQSFIF